MVQEVLLGRSFTGRVERRLAWGLGIGAAALTLAAGPLVAEEAKARLDLKPGKGGLGTFTVKRTVSGKQFTPRGESVEARESEVTYKVEVAERKENGDLVLKVVFGSLKAKDSGGEPWELDSAAKDDGADEGKKLLREVLASTATVTVSGGEITDVSGLPALRPAGADAPGGGGGRQGPQASGRRRVAGLVGLAALQRDLALILAFPAQGKDLEKGKEYKAAARRPEGTAGEKGGKRAGRGRFGGLLDGRGPPVTFRFEGEEKSAEQTALRFALAAAETAAPPGDGGDRPRFQRKSKGDGSGLFLKTDGAVLKLELTIEESSEGGRDDRVFKSQRTTKVSVTRGEPAKPAVKL
ncbi:MAG: hypothetical protein HY721_11365 [Planctomycetes bacterium]|nr:hypothetical protein [Planctomycetota bacterium]